MEDEIKIAITGDPMVGKTSLCQSYIYNDYSINCIDKIGCIIFDKYIFIDGKRIKLRIWDQQEQTFQPGQEYLYYRNAQGFMIVLDLSKKNIKEKTLKYLEIIRKKGFENKVSIVIVGNKSDLNEKDTEKEAFIIALENNFHFFSVSAKLNEGVDEAFTYLATQAYHHFYKHI